MRLILMGLLLTAAYGVAEPSPTVALVVAEETLTLEEAYHRARHAGPRVLEAQEAALAERARSRGTFGTLLPQVSANADWSVRSAETGGMRNTTHPRGHDLTLTQAITLWGEFSAWQRARSFADASMADAESTRQDVLLEVTAAYGDALAARDQAQSVRALVNALENDLKASNLRLKVGEGTKTDVAQSEARLAAAQADLVAAQALETAARLQLVRLVGGGENVGLLWPHLPMVENVNARVPESHPLLRAAEARARAERKRVNGAWANFLPEASLTATKSHSEDATFFGGGEVDDETVMVNVSLPLFAGGQNVAGLQEARAEARRAGYVLEDTRRDLQRLLATAENDLATANLRVNAAKKEVAAQERAAEGVRREQQLGTRSILDRLNAEQELANARTSLAAARRDRLLAYATLLAAQGRLDVLAFTVGEEAEK